jgi:O-antigen ligase
LIKERPVLGWGFSSLFGRLPGLGSADYFKTFGHTLALIDTTHNDILHIAFATGFIGLAAYVWVWATVLSRLWAVLRAGRPVLAPQAGIFAGMVAYLLWIQTEWSHIGPANVMWALVGVAVALTRTKGESGVPSMAVE